MSEYKLGTGNKNDNGVLEQGTDEIVKSYQEDTPGQSVDEYIKEKEKAFHEQKNKIKKHFSQVFGNHLKGFQANEDFEVKEIKEETAPFAIPDYPMQRVDIKYTDGSWAVGEEEKAYEYDASKSGEENMKLMGDEVKADRAKR